MGDFSVSCVLTGVTIHARRAALIPLAPAEYSNRQRPGFDEHHGVSVVSNEGAGGIFAPLTLPLFGETDSYGRLETVEEDEHTEFLTKRLGCTLDDLVESVCRGQALPAFTKLARKSRRGETKKRYHWSGLPWGAFVARAAWDEFSSASWDESGEPDATVWEDGWLNPQNLKGMGFVKGAKDQGRAEEIFGKGPHEGERYNVPYTHPELPGFTVWCDEHMSSQCEKGGKKFGVQKRYYGKLCESTIYKVDDFAKALKQQGARLPPGAEAWARKTPTYYAHLMDAKKRYLDGMRMDRETRKRLAENPSGHFRLISDTTPPEEVARHKEWVRARMNSVLKSKDGEEVPDPGPFVPRPMAASPTAGMPTETREKYAKFQAMAADAGASDAERAMATEHMRRLEEKHPAPEVPLIEQVFCDQDYSRRGTTHVTLRGPCAGDDATSFEISPCPGEGCKEARMFSPYLHFPAEVWPALRERGWKPPPGFSHRYGGLADPYVRAFCPEMRRLYGLKLYTTFLPRVIELLTFMRNMNAANKLLMPTNSGWQYGNYPTQKRVAQCAVRVINERLRERAEARRKYG